MESVNKMGSERRQFCPVISGRAVWFLVVLLAFAGRVAGQTNHFYVAPNGNDAWSGLRAAPDAELADGPFATLQRARDAVRERKRRQGDVLSQPVTVLLRGGVYHLAEPICLNAEDAGTEQAPITYAAYGDEKPVISGGRPIRGFKPVELDGKTVWAADLPEVREGKWFFHQLWVDGERWSRARYPKRGYVRVVAVPNAPEEWREGGNCFRYRDGDLGVWAVGGDTEVVVMNRWVESRLPVEHVDERERVVHFGKRSVFRLDPGDLYYVEHARSLLDGPGEWYLDRTAGVLYLVPLPGATPETIEVVAPVLKDVIRIKGAPAEGEWVEHLTFRGLIFSHTEWYFPPGSTMEYLRPDRTLEEAPYLKPDVGGCHQAAARVPAAVAVSGARGVTFEGCRFVHLGGYGLAFQDGCRHNRIAGCEMTDLGAGGVKIGETLLREAVAEQTFGNEVVDCHIHNVGRIFHSAVGIWVGQSYDNRLAHNHIHDLHYSAISIGTTSSPSDATSNSSARAPSRSTISPLNATSSIGPKATCLADPWATSVSPSTATSTGTPPPAPSPSTVFRSSNGRPKAWTATPGSPTRSFSLPMRTTSASAVTLPPWLWDSSLSMSIPSGHGSHRTNFQ